MHPLLNIAIQAARSAGRIINRGYEEIDSIKITEKQLNDFATNIDVQAEQRIIETIQKAHPEHAILAEESGQFSGSDDPDTQWIIDPLDGTRNFIHGFPHFAISIAVKVNQRIEHGVIYDPIRDDLFTASRGQGARLNNRRLRVSKKQELSQALVATGFPFRNKDILPTYLQSFAVVIEQCGGIRRAGSAALDLAYVAAGKLDGFWEYSLNIWDIAAGVLMVKEAGGFISDLQGGESYYQTGNIIAGNPKIFKGLLNCLRISEK